MTAAPVAVYTSLNYDRLAAIIQQYADWIWQLMPNQDQQLELLDIQEVRS